MEPQKKISSYFRGMRKWSIILLVFIVVLSCQERADDSQASELGEVVDIISNTKSVFAPDGRVAIFKIEAESRGSHMVLTGKTDLPDAKEVLLDSLSGRGVDVVDSIEVLPSVKLEGKIQGVVNNSVANIRSAPRHSGELATQALLGMPLRVLDQEGEWYLVQTPDDYISWIDHGGLVIMDDQAFSEWQALPKLIYRKTVGYAYKNTDEKGVVSDLVLGDVLAIQSDQGAYYKVTYPDDRSAFIRKTEATPFASWITSNENTADNLISNAQAMMGSPYLWGGTSTKGMDCSGFTKTLYLMNGLVIPRDASQQVHAGSLVDDQKDWSTLAPGDLLFFGTPKTQDKRERVVHVGMWIGDNSFIHASRQVRVSSVDPAAPNFDEFNVNRYLRTKRYINNVQGNIIDLRDEDIYGR